MIRRPPRPTLFPTRRSSDLVRCEIRRRASGLGAIPATVRSIRLRPPVARSEEHTSELQSRRDLVCRLLLEKKKKDQISADYGGNPPFFRHLGRLAFRPRRTP